MVTQALAKVPADRFPSARAFGDALGEAAAARADAPDDLPTMVVAARRGATRRRRGWLAAAVAVVLAGSGVGAAVLARKPAPLEPTRVMVLPFQNRTGDSSLDPLGDVAADYVARGLRVARGVSEVVDARSHAAEGTARSLTPAGARTLARDAGSGTIIVGAYDRAPGDSIQFQAEVLDTRTGRALRLIGPVSAPVADRLAAIAGVRTRVMAAVSSMFDLDYAEESSKPETYEALEEWAAAIDGLMHCQGDSSCEAQGIAHARRAFAIDSNFTLPLVSVAYTFMWSNCPRVDSIAAELQPRLARMAIQDGTQLRIATALCHGSLPDDSTEREVAPTTLRATR